jgi:hypothetical protein
VWATSRPSSSTSKSSGSASARLMPMVEGEISPNGWCQPFA